MEIKQIKKEELTTNSLAFMKKLAKTLSTEEDFVIDGFLSWHNIDERFTFENGEIVILDFGKCIYSCNKVLKKQIIAEKGRDYYDEHEKTIEKKTPLIKDVDFSDLKKLKELEYRYHDFDFDHDTVELDYFSLNEHKELETLFLTGNFIGELDISGCKKLKDISIYESSITKFDCSHNTELEILECGENNTSVLDLSNNRKLKYLSSYGNPIEKILFCDEYVKNPKKNPLKALKISNNTTSIDLGQLPNLKVLNYYKPFDTTLDLSKNKELQKIDFSSNTNLLFLDISNNHKLSEVDISNYKKTNTEIVCNEKQAFTIKDLAKKNKVKATEEQKEYLKTLKLHRRALDYESAMFDELAKILKNKYCDLATALLIYWRGNPNYYSRFDYVNDSKLKKKYICSKEILNGSADGIDENLHNLYLLEQHILEGKYSINIIPYDPKNDEGYDQTNYDYTDIKPLREIPEALKKAVKGKKIDGFDENKKITLTIKGNM